MKLVFLTAAVLMATSAWASSHKEHGYSAALHGIALDNACLTATEVRTISAVNHCTEMKAVYHVAHSDQDSNYTEMICTKSEVSKMSYPRAYEVTVCTEYNNPRSDRDNLTCLKTAQKAAFLPATIRVRTVTDIGDHDNFPGVESGFTFPSCQ